MDLGKVVAQDRRLINALYRKQRAIVRIAEGESEPCEIERGVRQGCLLSPLLFSVYTESMMRDTLEDLDVGVKVGGELYKDVRFADDQAMIASTEEGLQRMMNKLNEKSKEYDMKINIKKTKVMKVSREGGGDISIFLEGEEIEQETKFKYFAFQGSQLSA